MKRSLLLGAIVSIVALCWLLWSAEERRVLERRHARATALTTQLSEARAHQDLHILQSLGSPDEVTLLHAVGAADEIRLRYVFRFTVFGIGDHGTVMVEVDLGMEDGQVRIKRTRVDESFG